VDTPEVHHPSFPVQRFGKEAKQFVTDHFEGLKCYLEVDPKNAVDYYGRTLAYVYVNDVMINSELIRLGYGYSYSRYPHKRLNEFFDLEHQAIQHQYGLWNLSIMDGRIAKLVNDYESLSLDGRREYDRLVRELEQKYPRGKQ
jgi:micrococcal nuclease